MNKLSKNFKTGFTLVELLVVVSVLGVLAVIIGNVLSESLRGNTKAVLINNLKESGQSVVDKITKDIRSADSVVCITNPPASPYNVLVLRYTSNTNGPYQIRYIYSPQVGGASPSNGFIKRDNPDIVPSFENGSSGSMNSYCDLTNPQSGFQNPEIITNDDPSTGVSVKDDSSWSGSIFKQVDSGGTSPVIELKFNLFQGIAAGSAYERTLPSGVLFDTTAEIRTH